MPRETLRNIITQYGTSVCDDPRRVEALLRDLCGQHKREISVLVAALEEQVAEQLLGSQDGIPPEVVLSRLAKRLTDNRAIFPTHARWAVESWALALGVVSHRAVSKPQDLTTDPPSSPGRTPGGTTTLKPYVFCPGHVAKTVRDLPSVFDADWDRALEHFRRGYILDWLRDNISELRGTHQHGPADELERFAATAEETVRRLRGCTAHTRSIGLERFLRILGAERPTLAIPKAMLAFPATGPGTPGQPVTLTISNPGRGYLHGRVESKASWLDVKPEHFGCPAGQQCDIEARPDLREFSPGRRRVADALQVESNGGSATLPVEIEILAPPKLAVDTSKLDFGSIGLGYTGDVTFELRNLGVALLSGTVDSQVPWLSLSPTRFQVPSKGSAAIKAVADCRLLKPGTLHEADALRVDSNGGHHRLHALVQVESPSLHVDIEDVCVGLGPDGRGTASLRVTNTGAGLLEFRASVEPPPGNRMALTHWIGERGYDGIGVRIGSEELLREDAAPPQLTRECSCPPGQSTILHVIVHAASMSPNAPLPEGRLMIKSNGGDKSIRVTTERYGPWLYVEADEIDLGRYAEDPPPTELLYLRNLGNERLTSRIETQDPWLEATASSVEIPPKDCVAVEVRPISEGRVRLAVGVLRRRLSSMVRIEWSGGEVEIPVRMVTEYHG